MMGLICYTEAMTKTRKRPSGNCTKCGCWRTSLHWDHVVPKWQGGSDEAENRQLICANCHEDKTYQEAISSEFKALMSRLSKGKKRSPTSRGLMCQVAQKRAQDPVYRQRLSAALKGKTRTTEQRLNLHEVQTRRWQDGTLRQEAAQKARSLWATPGHREKMQKAFAGRPAPVGRPHTEEAKQKMREYALHRPPVSEATRQKMSQSAREAARRRFSMSDETQAEARGTEAETRGF